MRRVSPPGGNPIPYKHDDSCGNTVLYSEAGSVDEEPVVYEDVHFSTSDCHRYGLRGIVLQSDYGNIDVNQLL